MTCVDESQCPTDNVCRSSSCVVSEHTVGWEAATSSQTAVTANWIYWQKLPQLSYDAELLAFGVNGTSAGVNFKLALYPDNGTGTAAGPNFLVRTFQDIAGANGARETQSLTPTTVTLQKNTTYWLAVRADAGTNVKSAAETGLLGFRTDGSSVTHFPVDLHATAVPQASNNTARAIYIRVRDVE